MKKILQVILFVFLIASCCFPVYAQQEAESLIENRLENLGLNQVENAVGQALEQQGNDTDFSFSQIVKQMVTGEFDWSMQSCFKQIAGLFFSEIRTQLGLIQKILLIAILSSVLKTLNNSFQTKAVGELGFAICYIVMVSMVMTSFTVASQIVSEVIDSIVSFIQVMIPVITTLMFTSGNYTQMAVSGPIIVGTSGIISNLIQVLILPAITMVTMVQMINFISEKSILNQLTDLMKSIIGWGLKGFSIVFMAIISLQKIGVTGIGKLAGKTARVAVGSVPVVGDVMAGAVDMAANLSNAIQSGVAAAAVIFLIVLALIPVIKLIVMILIYKLTAAVLEPVCETRLVKCIGAAGDFTVLLLSTLFAVEMMFIFAVIVLLSVV